MRALTTGVLLVLGALGFGQPASRDLRLTLTEGTSMSAALSPDGRTLVVDLLGALWTLDAGGGSARRILEDGYDAHLPSWSPDGGQIAFQAYRSSTWSIWTIGSDGSGLRQLTSGPFDDREPQWAPDGATVAFASDRGGSYDVWTVTAATGALQRITTGAANDFMPSWSPDGSQIAFVSDRREQPGIYAISVRDTSGERMLHAAAGAQSPSWGQDGTIAYVAPGARLMVGGRDISDADEDVFAFRPQWVSATELLYTGDGKIKRRAASGGPARVVEFTAAVSFARAAFTPKGRDFPVQGEQAVRGIMHPAISPDGTQVVFAALGDLWLMQTAPGSPPKRLTADVFYDTEPAWSPDGAMIAFASDRDGTMDLWVRDLRSGRDRRVARRGMSASWSPDGKRIAFLDPESQLQLVDVDGTNIRKVHDRLNEPGRPSWSPDGRVVVMSALKTYSTRFREGTNQVLRVSLGGEPDRWIEPLPHKSVGMREDSGPVWSPDGSQMAATIDGQLAAFPVAADGTPLGPPRRLSADLAGSPTWTADARRILYQADDRLKLVDVVDGSVREILPSLTWSPRPVSKALTTVHAGRVFDGTAVRENVDILIEGNRITSVEPHRDLLHAGSVVDASDGTVLPGLIESHAHLAPAFGEAFGRIWLAFGITTMRNPASNPFEGVESREAFASGTRIGPRVFIAGEPLDGTRVYYPGGTALDGGAQLALQLGRAETLGFDLIKAYVRLPDLLQKRVIEEAHRRGLPVTSHELYPAVAYGVDGIEHIRGTSRRGFSPKMSELRRSYRDVIDLLAASRMTLTPTIGIQGGNELLTGRDPSWTSDPRIRTMFPEAAWRPALAFAERADAQALAQIERLVSPQEAMVAAVVQAGGRVIAGTDSPIIPYGLALLMELEHYVRGGLSPAQAIRTATIVPAEAMGVGADMGSIERGMLADLVIVDGNPLVNIVDIRRTRRVIKDGVVYEVDALTRGPARGAPPSVAR